MMHVTPLSEAGRFVHVTPFGARHWLAQCEKSPERAVIEYLLSIDAQRPIDMKAMSVDMAWPKEKLAKILFTLNRTLGIQIDIRHPPHDASAGDELAGLNADLQMLAGVGQHALLASSDGLCIAASGWSSDEADVIAGGVASAGATGAVYLLTWCFAREQLMFCSSRRLENSHPSWSRMARRLLRACGPLGYRFEAD